MNNTTNKENFKVVYQTAYRRLVVRSDVLECFSVWSPDLANELLYWSHEAQTKLDFLLVFQHTLAQYWF